jgi:hypothetical protein
MIIRLNFKRQWHKNLVYLWCPLIVIVSLQCNNIRAGDDLAKSDIKYIRSLGLLSTDETIINFYSELNTKAAGNFYTNKRITKYWIDKKNPDKNTIRYAFYADIKSIDTIYNAGLTYCPYMLVTKHDGKSFKVCADGSKDEIRRFFEGALKIWADFRGKNVNVEQVFYPTYTKELEQKTQTIDLMYIQFFCQCPNWIKLRDYKRHADTKELVEHCIFIEPDSINMALPDSVGYHADIVRFTGRFYKEKGYPKSYPKSEMKVEKAPVFRYASYQVIKSNYRNFIGQ